MGCGASSPQNSSPEEARRGAPQEPACESSMQESNHEVDVHYYARRRDESSDTVPLRENSFRFKRQKAANPKTFMSVVSSAASHHNAEDSCSSEDVSIEKQSPTEVEPQMLSFAEPPASPTANVLASVAPQALSCTQAFLEATTDSFIL